jgi:hypothetical protein
MLLKMGLELLLLILEVMSSLSVGHTGNVLLLHPGAAEQAVWLVINFPDFFFRD